MARHGAEKYRKQTSNVYPNRISWIKGIFLTCTKCQKLIDFSTFVCMGTSEFVATGGCDYICMYQPEDESVWDSNMVIEYCTQITSPQFYNGNVRPPKITACVTYSTMIENEKHLMAVVGFDNSELGTLSLS